MNAKTSRIGVTHQASFVNARIDLNLIKRKISSHFLNPSASLTKPVKCTHSSTTSQNHSSTNSVESPQVKKVYFIGNSPFIQKYTNKDGEYITEIGDSIRGRYEIRKRLDSGSFGTVFDCLDHKTKQAVALKALKKTKTSKAQASNEFGICTLLANTNTIYSVKKTFEFNSHFFLVFELLSLSLYDFLKQNTFAPLNTSLVKRITVQLLLGLSQIHSKKIIHCDIKPENILFNHPNKSSIKIIDFGSACFSDQKVFNYIQSRLYRAPEIMLQSGYNEAIDMWSLGCVVAEMLLGVPLFVGDNEKEMICSIVNVIGLPPRALVDKSKARHLLKNNLLEPGTQPLKRLFVGFSNEIIDFLVKCFVWVPEERLTAKEALLCNWIRGVHVRAASVA